MIWNLIILEFCLEYQKLDVINGKVQKYISDIVIKILKAYKICFFFEYNDTLGSRL